MYGMMCATTEDEVAELRGMNDAAFTARVFGGGKTPSLMENHERTLHLEKLWAALDFVLTGSTLGEPAASPLDFLRPRGPGEPVGPDLRQGRARLLSPAQVRAIADAVSALPREAIDARVSSPRLSGLYPFSEASVDQDELRAAAERAISASPSRDPSVTAASLAAQLTPSRGVRPNASDRAEIREALDELRAFLAKLVRARSGALISIA